MSTTVIRLALGAVLVAGAVLLTGCDPATTADTSSDSADCDPNGFGPLSGCGRETSSQVTAATSDDRGDTSASSTEVSISFCDPAWVRRAAAEERGKAKPGETWAVSDGCGHTEASDPQTKADSQAWDKKFDAALQAGPPPFDGTVVATHRDGFAECVVDVEATNGNEHQRFTASTCPAVGSHYHQKGGW